MYISQQIAATAVQSVISGRNLTLALPEAMKRYPAATPQQRAVAADLSYGTLRFYGEVSAYLALLLEKPLSSEIIQHLLHVALYQLLHDHAEAFTVVNQAVNAASQAKPRWAKSLVNGVLRNFLRQKDALTAILSSNEVAVYSYPQWWINKLKRDYPENFQSILQNGNLHPPMTLRVNTRYSSVAKYLALLESQNIDAKEVGEQAIILTKPMPVEKIPLFVEGAVSVQDYGAQLAAPLLDLNALEANAGMRVLDACAAPGGKACHILELSNVELTAVDSDSMRLNRVASNLKRLNLAAKLIVGDAANASSWWDGKPYDRILADVPCTASGIVRRHVDIKWLRRESDIVSFTQQQAAILHSLWQLLAKGGKLLYVTCSVFIEENQRQIDTFLSQNTDATQLPIQLNPAIELTQDAAKNIHIYQGQCIPATLHDGFFYAMLQKS